MILTASSRRGFILAGEPACAIADIPGDHAGNRGRADRRHRLGVFDLGSAECDDLFGLVAKVG